MEQVGKRVGTNGGWESDGKDKYKDLSMVVLLIAA